MAKKIFPKIGLALGGGGSRGYAHIGVLKILEQNNIPIDFIAGTSAGALVGAMYAFSKNSEQVEKAAVNNDLSKLLTLAMDFSFEKGMIKGEKTKQFLSQILEKSSFDSLKIPFKAVATDFDTAEEVVIKEGDIASAVQASATFPLVFKPVKLMDRNLWDGGMSNPVPADTVKAMGADIVIAVNLYNKTAFDSGKKTKDGIYEVAAKAIESLQYNLSKECIKSADIIIEPKITGLGFLGLDRFLKGRGEGIILEGEKTAVEVLPKIKEAIDRFIFEKNRTPIQKAGDFFKKIGK
jgi:NTE family protein